MRQANLPLEKRGPLPSATLLYGDCLEVMPTLPEKSVQMVFADLPYHAAKHLNWDKVPFDLMSFSEIIQQKFARSSPLVFTANMPFASRLMRTSMRFRHDLVWHKQCPSNIFASKKQPLNYHEHILIFSDQNRIPYNPQMLPEEQRGQILSRKRTLKAMSKKFFGDSKQHECSVSGPLLPRSVLLNIKRDAVRKTLHPTQKPVALLEWLIRTYTNDGDTVLDPTAGSGTTAIAAMRTGRHSICIEKDEQYFAVMQKRVADERARLELE